MLKNQSILEVKRGDRIYQLNLHSDSPLGEVFDVLMEIRQFVVDRINEANKLDAQKGAEAATSEPSSQASE